MYDCRHPVVSFLLIIIISFSFSLFSIKARASIQTLIFLNNWCYPRFDSSSLDNRMCRFCDPSLRINESTYLRSEYLSQYAIRSLSFFHDVLFPLSTSLSLPLSLPVSIIIITLASSPSSCRFYLFFTTFCHLFFTLLFSSPPTSPQLTHKSHSHTPTHTNTYKQTQTSL